MSVRTGDGDDDGKPGVEDVPTSRQPTVRPRRLSGVRVVLVDDDEDARELLAAALTREEALVRCAGDVEQALALLRSLVPDVVVSDITLPGRDGFALLDEVRRLARDRGRALPVIAISGHAQDADRACALEAGFHAYVTKPLDLCALFALLEGVRASRGAPSTRA